MNYSISKSLPYGQADKLDIVATSGTIQCRCDLRDNVIQEFRVRGMIFSRRSTGGRI